MTTNIGNAEKPLKHHAESLSFDPLTADPSSTEKGEMWLRTDLDGEVADQLATLRFNDGSTVRDIPVLDLYGDHNYHGVLGVDINGQRGIIPVDDPEEVTLPELAVQLGNSRLAFDSLQEPSTIPDSEDLYIRTSTKEINFNDGENVSTLEDLVGDNDLTGEGTYRDEQINGNPAIDYDLEDKHTVGFNAITPPFSIFGVWGWDTLTSDSDYIFDTHDIDGSADGALREDNWRGAGSDLSFSSDTNIHIWGIIVTNSETVIRQDGSVLVSGDVGTVDWDMLGLGGRGSTLNADSTFGEVLGYQADKSDSQEEIEDYLDSEWGPILS